MVGTIEKQVLQSKIVERIQQVQQQHAELQQHYFAVQLGEERRRRLSRIGEAEESAAVPVGEEKGRRRQQDRPEPPAAPAAAEDGQPPDEPDAPGHIDIKV